MKFLLRKNIAAGMNKKNISTEQLVAGALLVCVLAVTAVMFRYGMFTVPLADDYNMMMPTHNVWENTHSVWAVLGKAFYTAGLFYTIWSGEFTSILLQTLCPGLGDYSTYYLGSWMLIVVFLAAFYYLMHAVCARLFHGSRAQWLIVSSGFVLVLLQTVPSLYDLFYWWNASIGYIFMFSLRMFALGAAIRQWNKVYATRRQLLCAIPIWVLSMWAGCGKMMAGLALAVVMVLMAAYSVYRKRNRRFYCINAAAYVAGCIIALAAPGNYARAQHMGETMGIVHTLLTDLAWGHEYLSQWMTVLLVLVALALLPVIVKLVCKVQCSFRCPALISIVSYGIFAAQFSSVIYTGYYTELEAISAYTQNVLYCAFLLLWMGNVFYWTGWVVKHVTLRKPFAWKSYGVLVAAALVCEIFLVHKPLDYNSVLQISMLQNNTCGEYRNEMLAREELLRTSEEEDVVLPRVPSAEKMLVMRGDTAELTENKEDWLNVVAAQYYHKRSVRVAGE